MSDTAERPPRMTVDEFVAWAEGQPGRFELYDGEVVKMQSEREVHTSVKLSVAIALRNALSNNRHGCRAYTDGRTIKVDAETSFEPDAVIDCGLRDPDSIFADRPVVVVEVISPSTSRIDSGMKLAGYFAVPSVAHYPIVDVRRRFVIHHRREGENSLASIMHARQNGMHDLDTPGIAVAVADFFADLPPVENA